MQNKYLINSAKRFWFWFWQKLMNGFAPSDIQGNYKRPKGILIDKTYDFQSNTEKTYLLVGNSCPWCHRTLLVYKLKNLSKKIKVIFLKADVKSGQWVFVEKFEGCENLYQFYKKAKKHKDEIPISGGLSFGICFALFFSFSFFIKHIISLW